MIEEVLKIVDIEGGNYFTLQVSPKLKIPKLKIGFKNTPAYLSYDAAYNNKNEVINYIKLLFEFNINFVLTFDDKAAIYEHAYIDYYVSDSKVERMSSLTDNTNINTIMYFVECSKNIDTFNLVYGLT